MIIEYQYGFIFLFMLIAMGIFSLPIFSFIDPKKNTSARKIQFDALRAFLAIFVVFTHSVAMFYLFTQKEWINPNHKIGYLAGIGVSIFFILTGYLFWGKLKNSETIDWFTLYINRSFRIIPLIFFQSIVCISVILLATKPDINLKNIDHLIVNALPWFDVLNNNKPELFGYKNSFYVSGGVLWSIAYEWGFYFTLPVLFLFRNKALPFIVGLLFVLVYGTNILNFSREFYYVFLFTVGLATNQFKDYFRLNKRYLDLLLLLCFISILIFRPQQIINSYIGILFFLITVTLANGADLFGLFRLKSLERLGIISYSIYIIHPPVLYVSFILYNKYDVSCHNSFILLYAPILLSLLISSLTYKFIELPFIELGKKIKHI